MTIQDQTRPSREVPTFRQSLANGTGLKLTTAVAILTAIGALVALGVFPRFGDIFTKQEAESAHTAIRVEVRDSVSAIRAETDRQITSLKDANAEAHAAIMDALKELKADVRVITRRQRDDR